MDELLDAVLADPDALGPRKVVGDFLLDRSDPRGELIALQCLLAEPGLSEERQGVLRARQQELLYLHEEGWLASHGLLPGEGEFVRGFLETLTLRGARLAALRGLGRCPLRKVRLIDVSADTLPALVELPRLGRLKSLHLSGNLAGQELRSLLWLGKLEGLTTLELTGLPLGLPGAQALASLRGLQRLVLVSCRLGVEELEVLARALPSLTELLLSNNTLGPRGLEVIGTWCSLVRLELRNDQIDPEGAAALARATHLDQLVKLDLAYNSLGPEGARVLAQSHALPALNELSLRYCGVTLAGLRAILYSEGLRGVRVFYVQGNDLAGPGYERLLEKFGDRLAY